VREQRLDDFQAARLLRFYEEGLNGYTYLEDVAEDRMPKVGPYAMPARVAAETP
jgi:hypothetical protein